MTDVAPTTRAVRGSGEPALGAPAAPTPTDGSLRAPPSDSFAPGSAPNPYVSADTERASLSSPVATGARAESEPGFFRTVLELAETALRFIPFVNLFLAAARVLLLAFDWIMGNDIDWGDQLTRLGLDLLGGMFPPAAALGHLALNAWWGADNKERAELLAGYDRFLGQGGQKTWLGSKVEWLFDRVGGWIHNDDAPSSPDGRTIYGADGSLALAPPGMPEPVEIREAGPVQSRVITPDDL